MKKRKNSERKTKMKPFINKYKWEGIHVPSEKDDWKRFEKYNVTISLNVSYTKKQKIYPAFVSKHNSNRAKPVTILMISNKDKWHDLAVKKTVNHIKRINFKTSWWFLLSGFPSFSRNRNKT